MDTLSSLLASMGEIQQSLMIFFHKVPVMQSFDVFFFVSLNELFKKQLGWQLYRMLMWHHYNVHVSPLRLQEINNKR